MHRTKKEHYKYLNYRDKILQINEHYDDCIHKNKPWPINKCECNCYEEQIFLLGVKNEIHKS
jgi:hypothetical protein